MAKRRCIYVTTRLPMPVSDGFASRAFNTIRVLSEAYDLDVLYSPLLFDKRKTTFILTSEMPNIRLMCSRFGINMARAARFNIFDTPVQVFMTCFNAMNPISTKYDMAFGHLIRTWPLIEEIDATRKCLDVVDYLPFAYRNATGPFLQRQVKRFDAARFDSILAKASAGCDALLFCNPNEIAHVLELGIAGNCVHMPNGVDDKFGTPRQQSHRREEGVDVVFYGSFVHEPNEQAGRILLEHVIPAYKREYGRIDVIVFGPFAQEKLGKYEGEGVHIMGHVEDHIRLLDSAKALVAPIVSHSGVQIKVLESLIRGLAVVTTPEVAGKYEGIRNARVIGCQVEAMHHEIKNILGDMNHLSVNNGLLAQNSWKNIILRTLTQLEKL